MKKTTIYIIISAIFISLIIPVNTTKVYASGSKWPDEPHIASQNIVLMDADTGRVLYEKNANSRCYPASTTSLMTGLVTVENSALSDSINFSQNAVNSLKYGDSNAAIVAGETMSIEQALNCLYLRSAYEVAYGLAENTNGTVSSFVELMNTRAAGLGAKNTHFSNPSGRSDSNHYTTPFDMALIARACLNNDTIMGILSYSKVYKIAPTNINTFTRYYKNSYQMLPGGNFEYKYAIGGKTGNSTEAGSCLISYAQKDDQRLICVVMNSTDSDKYKDTITLFDYIFNNFKRIYVSEYESGISFNSLEIFDVTGSVLQDSNVNIKFNDDAYVLVPVNVFFYDLTSIMTYADSESYSGDSSGFANIHYFYNNKDVGVATIYINENNNTITNIGTNGVPSYKSNSERKENNYIIINIWYIVGGLLITLLITLIIVYNYKRPARNYSKKYRQMSTRFRRH